MNETTDYGYRHLRRSAYAHDTGRGLDIYLGVCEAHGRPVRHEGTPEGPAGMGHYWITCPVGGERIKAERLVAVTSHVVCDGSCMGAIGPNCDCGCGGMNHGKSWGTSATREQYESAMAKYQARQERVRVQREKRHEAAERKARRSFDDWKAENAELVAGLEAHKPDELGNTPEGGNYFLTDMARIVHIHGKRLTEGQASAAERVLAEHAARQVARAANEAARREREASAKPVPEGKVKISGEIVKIKCSEGYMADSVRTQAIVAADGYAVMITLPRVVDDYAMDKRRAQLWEGYERPSYSGTDYEGASIRWTNALRGVKITFTATVERSRKDPSFGFGKRPTKVSFTPLDECCDECEGTE